MPHADQDTKKRYFADYYKRRREQIRLRKKKKYRQNAAVVREALNERRFRLRDVVKPSPEVFELLEMGASEVSGTELHRGKFHFVYKGKWRTERFDEPLPTW